MANLGLINKITLPNGNYCVIPVPSEYADETAFPATGVAGQQYISKDSNKIYRWDATENDYVMIGGGGGGGGGSGSAMIKKAISIAATDWSSVTGGYSATVTDSRITSDAEAFMFYDSSVNNLTSGIDVTKTTGRVTFTTATIPTGAISGTLYIITALVVDTKVNIAQGVENAGKAMIVDNNGNLEPTTLPSGLPTVTAADNGKILQVVNGAWALVTLESASGVIY